MKNELYIEKFSVKEDIIKLQESFNLLKKTTENVSTEAIQTANFLKKQLVETNYRFYHVIDSINDIVLIKDGQGRWKTLNAFGRKVFGFKEISDYYNKTDYDLANDFPQHESGLDYCINSDKNAWNADGYYRCFEVFNVNGESRTFDVIKTPSFDNDGNRKELIIIGRDITDLKDVEYASETSLSFLNSASDIIIVISNSGIINFANQMFIKTFGFKDNSEVENKNLFNLITNQYCECFNVSILDTIDSRHVWSGETFRVSNDKIIPYFTTIIPVMNGDPTPHHFICRMHLIDQ